MIRAEFDVTDVTNKGDILRQEERFGYQSVHYNVSLKRDRAVLPEYSRYSGLIAEIQVRTVLQHAWAEIEHDIQYKSADAIPATIRRRFMTLAGILELADREFQTIQDDDEQIRLEARQSIQEGKLEAVEITGDALHAYLDAKLGPDFRQAEWSYEWAARELHQLGFCTFNEVDACISGYNDDLLSRLRWGNRQGQISRFDNMILAGMGEAYIERHPWRSEGSFASNWRRVLERFRHRGLEVGKYVPPGSNSRPA